MRACRRQKECVVSEGETEKMIAVAKKAPAVIGQVVQVILLALVGWFAAWNYEELEESILRFLRKASEVSVAGVITVTTERISTPSSSGFETWATYDRISSAVAIDLVEFNDRDGEGHEYFDIVARKRVDLSGGYVGDGGELLRLPLFGLRLSRDECLTIYTHKGKGSLPADRCGKKVFAERLDCKESEGIFTFRPGRGDRIVILDGEGLPILDMDYWWLTRDE